MHPSGDSDYPGIHMSARQENAPFVEAERRIEDAEVPNLSKFSILPFPLPNRNRDKYWRTVAEELQKTITKFRESPRPDHPTFPRPAR